MTFFRVGKEGVNVVSEQVFFLDSSGCCEHPCAWRGVLSFCKGQGVRGSVVPSNRGVVGEGDSTSYAGPGGPR